MTKRTREAAGYDVSVERRVAHTVSFIKNLKFSKSLGALGHVKRAPCPKCNKRRLFYCYDCVEVCHPPTHPPPLRLPINVYVVFHPGELRGKSTSLPAATISPDIHIVIYPEIPAHLSKEDTLVLYPSNHAVSVDEVCLVETGEGEVPSSVDRRNLADQKSKCGVFSKYKNIVIIDSTWQQSKAIARDERVKAFKHVRIKSQTSLFWRFQNNDPSYLATVEAIYYFLREFTTCINKLADNVDSTTAVSDTHSQYHGEVDDILFYYIYQYILVQRSYQLGHPPEAVTDEGIINDSNIRAPCVEEQKDSEKKEDETNKSTMTWQKKDFTTRHFDGYLLFEIDWTDLLKSKSF